MKTKLKASLELIKQLSPLVGLSMVVLSLFVPFVVLFCKYVSIVWNLMF